jgi:hypothetical protein
MVEEASREIRIKIIDFIMFAKYADNSLMMTSLGWIKEENLWFCDYKHQIYARSITNLSC